MSTKEFLEQTGYTAEQLTSASRSQELVTPRHVCMWILQKNGLSYPSIGKIFNRNYSTVIHAKNKIDDMISINDYSTLYYIEKLQN